MTAQVQTTELVKQMSGKNTLNGWDVLVSYNEDQINKLLSLRASSLTGLSNLSFTTEEKKPFSKPPKMIKINWKIQLSQPKLQFLGSQGRIRLAFALAGSRTPENDDTWDIDPGFNVQIETQLLNVQGTLSDMNSPATADFVPGSSAAQSATPANSIVLMPPDSGAAQAVCLNLVDDKIPIEIVSTSSPPAALPDELILVQTRLREHIRSAVGLKYYIAGLTNVYSSSSGSDLLKPKTFCFTCVPGDPSNDTPGSLCMWIGVEGGESGARSTGQTSVTFHPADTDLHPIPKDSTASVIFSHRLMASYIVSAMRDKSIYDSFSITSNVGTAGIEIKAKCNKKVTKDFSQYTTKGEYVPPAGFKFEQYSSVSFDMHDENTVFRFGKQDAFRDISIAYVSGIQTLHWVYAVVNLVTSSPNLKTLTLKFAHGGSAVWADDRTPDTKTPNMLKLRFTLPDKFQAKDKNVTERILFWDKDNAEAPKHYKDISVPLPTLDFDLRGLDYFLTTNLILPGAHLFIADEPTGKKGGNFGLFMPRDVLLTGQVAAELKAAQ